MSRIDLVRQMVEEQLDDPYYLLALRLIFPPDRVEVKTDKEISDLYVYPERLEAIPRCIHNHIDLFRRLGEVLKIRQSDNTIIFPDPGRRAVMDIIWPKP
jgi:hypothetical protein